MYFYVIHQSFDFVASRARIFYPLASPKADYSILVTSDLPLILEALVMF